MKEYPSIDYWNKGIFGLPVWAFDKIDGSNIRVEWNRKLSKKSLHILSFALSAHDLVENTFLFVPCVYRWDIC